MNLIEAIKTGRPIKRKSKFYDFGHLVNFVTPNNISGIEFSYKSGRTDSVYLADVLADDWEVQELTDSEKLEVICKGLIELNRSEHMPDILSLEVAKLLEHAK